METKSVKRKKPQNANRLRKALLSERDGNFVKSIEPRCNLNHPLRKALLSERDGNYYFFYELMVTYRNP